MANRRSAEGVMALDIGTSSVRAVVYDVKGRMVDSTLCDLRYEVRTADPGEVSSDPDAMVKLVGRTIDGALRAAHKERMQILAVGTSCYWHSLLGIDGKGRPTTEVLTWADTRSASHTRRLRIRNDEVAYHRRTGCFFHASYWPAKLRWLRADRPGDVRRTVRWISFGEYLYKELFGDLRVSLSMASGTGLLNVDRCRWDGPSLRLAGIRAEQLSTLAEGDQPNRELRPPFARRWRELRSIPWYLPAGDGALANIGAGAVNPRWACATIGTSGALRIIADKPRMQIPWGTFVYRLDRRHVVIGGALSEGGNLVRWLTDRLGLDHGDELEAAAARLEPDGHGLTVLPFWAGERSPNWRADARGVIAGLSLATDPADLLRATMEAIAYQFATISTAIGRTAHPRAIVGTGGQLVHSPAWAQMLADCLNLPVVISPEREASSRGAALLVLHAEGRLPNLWSASPAAGRRYRPRRRMHDLYERARSRQQQLYDLLFPPLGRPEHATPSAALGSGSRTRDLRSPAARH